MKWQWAFSAVNSARIVLDLIIKVLEEWEAAGARCCSTLEVEFLSKKSNELCLSLFTCYNFLSVALEQQPFISKCRRSNSLLGDIGHYLFVFLCCGE